MPLRYLYEPWKAPRAVQEKANCVVGVDYPLPMVDHQTASKDCYYRMMEVKNRLLAFGKGKCGTVCFLYALDRLVMNS